MIGRRRRVLCLLAWLGAVGLAVHYAATQLADLPASRLEHAAETLAQSRRWLARHGLWMHLAAHGAMYLCLLCGWPHLLQWVDRRRAAGGQAPLAAAERRRLAATLVAVVAAYEGLLLLRQLG